MGMVCRRPSLRDALCSCALLLFATIMRLVVCARALRDRARLPLQSAAVEALDERLMQRARGDCGARSYAFL